MFIRIRKVVIALGLLFYYLFLVLCVISYKNSKILNNENVEKINPLNLKEDHFYLKRLNGKIIFILDPHPSAEVILEDPRVACSVESAGIL
jgi:hypothetical protein